MHQQAGYITRTASSALTLGLDPCTGSSRDDLTSNLRQVLQLGTGPWTEHGAGHDDLVNLLFAKILRGNAQYLVSVEKQ